MSTQLQGRMIGDHQCQAVGSAEALRRRTFPVDPAWWWLGKFACLLLAVELGLSANVLYSASSSVRYQSRPESHLAPHVIDTGNIDAHNALVVGAEAAWVNGPFSLQVEYLHSHVKWRFDYGFGHVAGRTPEGNLNIFETRVEIDF